MLYILHIKLAEIVMSGVRHSMYYVVPGDSTVVTDHGVRHSTRR